MPRSIVVGVVCIVVGIIVMVALAPVIPHPGDTIVWWVGLLVTVLGAIYALFGVLGLVSNRPPY